MRHPSALVGATTYVGGVVALGAIGPAWEVWAQLSLAAVAALILVLHAKASVWVPALLVASATLAFPVAMLMAIGSESTGSVAGAFSTYWQKEGLASAAFLVGPTVVALVVARFAAWLRSNKSLKSGDAS